MNGEKEAPDRYPQNSQLAMVVNVVLAYPFYMAAIIAMIAAAVIIVALPIKLFSSRQAKYPFSQEEMERFGMSEKAKRLSEPMRVQKSNTFCFCFIIIYRSEQGGHLARCKIL